MNHQPYDLLDEPWIDVLDVSGEARSVGLLDAFRQAHRLSAIKGDLATQDVAIFRLLLAILRRAIADEVEDSGDPVAYWAQLQAADTLPISLIEEYLERHRDRFDLTHPQTPFMQVAGDTSSKHSGLQKLIADLPDTEDKQLFTTRSGQGALSLELPEAARWLVHAHAFDPSGIKTGLVGDPRAKGGKGYPIGLGWSGNCGILLAQGSTLKESLLLNLVLRHVDPDDLPPWELPQDGAGPRMERRGVAAQVKGPTQAMVWQTRRVVLRFDETGDRVVDVTLGNGDPITPQNRWDIEDHTAWRYSANQSKKGADVFFPLGADPDRALWRGISGVLAVEPTRGRVTGKPAPQQRAGLVEWLARLVDKNVLPPGRLIPLRVTGAVYGTQNSVIDAVSTDVIDLPAAVYADAALQRLAVNAVSDAEAATVALRGLARDLCRAAGLDSGDGRADDASQRSYAELGRRYAAWVRELTPDVDTSRTEIAWQQIVRSCVREVAEEMIRNAGQAAIVGRRVERLGGRVEHLDVGSASGRFLWTLSRALPLLAPAPRTDNSPSLPSPEGA